jgi:hypothetical protein
MPGLFVSPHNLASRVAVKPASIHQWVSSILSNPKSGFLTTNPTMPGRDQLQMIATLRACGGEVGDGQ